MITKKEYEKHNHPGDNLVYCWLCKKDLHRGNINNSVEFVQIKHWRNINDITYLNFHPECFLEIASDEYVVEE